MQNKLSKQELKDIIQWDVKNWKSALPFWEKHFEIKPGMKVLALGERDGGLSLYFAQKGCTVVCSDYSEISEGAYSMHKSYGVDNKITYDKIDMRAINYDSDSFDIVVFKSVIGALGSADQQAKAISEINRVLKKDGAFLFAENALASRLHAYLRKKFTAWQGHWYYAPDKKIDGWKSKYQNAYSKKIGFVALFGRSERQRAILGTIDSVLQYLVPKKWRYIFLGVFIK